MLEHKEHFHGSDLELIEEKYGISKENITSFSANVNPLGISSKLRKKLCDNIDVITSYPDREYSSLREAIARYVGSTKRHIAVGNGSTELISIMMQITKPKHAILFAPSYSEYEHELECAGGKYEYYELKEENNFVPDLNELFKMITDETDLLIICNPNNPTSYAINNDVMAKILNVCQSHNTIVMVDETYVEFAPDYKHISCVALTKIYDNLVILRGISKFFAAPGLRLGYAICSDKELLRKINEKKNPWTINSLAAIAGEIMFSDEEYIKATKELINKERQKVTAFLNNIPCLKAYESFGNFILVRILNDKISANDLFETAIRKGLMIRDCSTFQFLDEHYFRFCFMSPEKNDELLNVIKETFTE